MFTNAIAIQPTSTSFCSFFNEAYARGTWFELLDAPWLEVLVDQIESWTARGMPMDAIPWQVAPPEVREFERPSDGFFPRGFLAQMEWVGENQVQLSLWSRRIDMRDGERNEQIERWTQKCYHSIVHYYRVLKPLHERLSTLTIIHIC